MLTHGSYSLSQVFGTGLTISLEFEEEGVPQYVLSRVEETSDNRLWVAMPTRANTFLPLAIGTAIIAYIKHGDIVFLLQGEISGRRLQPVPMLELTPTSPLQQRQPREFARLRIALVPTSLSRLEADGSSIRLAATIVNLSAGGVLLRTRQPLEVGQRLHLTVELPTPGGVIDQVIEVLRSDQRRTERGHLYEAGCTFEALTEGERQSITHFVYRSQARVGVTASDDIS